MYLPINISLKNITCLVVGAGGVAQRKIKTLLRFGAKIKVVAPRQTKTIKNLASRGKIKLLGRNFTFSDLKGAYLVIAATDDAKLNKAISRAAKKMNILVNVADQPRLCTFITPAVIKRGHLVISICTSGKAPAFSAGLRKILEKIITPEFKNIVNNLGKIRSKKGT